MEKLEIKLENCNSIDEGNIIVEKGGLNIKYGINGTGKTTITKAIQYTLGQNKDLEDLKPFKYIESKEGISPKIFGLEDFNKVAVFNEDYVNNITFKESGELLEGSFDIFINNSEYKEGLKEIDLLTLSIKNTIIEDEEIKKLISDLSEFIKMTGTSKDLIAKNSTIFKALGDKGNIRENIPNEIAGYSDYINSDLKTSVGWITWQSQGKDYLDIKNENCPYCISNIDKADKNRINKVYDTYNKNDFKHLNDTINILSSLSHYFSDLTNNDIEEIKNNINGLSKEQLDTLTQIKQQSSQLFSRLDNLKVLGFFNIKNIDEIEKVIGGYRINISKYSCFNSSYTTDKIRNINSELDIVLKRIIDLKKAIGKQETKIRQIIQSNKDEIETFLINAGYKYVIDSEETEDKYKLVLKHKDCKGKIENAKNRLSYGEKNAFALVLFMFQAVSDNADFIILDDPISSFDNNKKYSILNRLFGKGGFFVNKTVLMLTHDFEPIVDIIYHNNPNLKLKNAYFLQNNLGILSEQKIEKSDVKTFLKITKENILVLKNNINKLIYVRRLCELNEDNYTCNTYNLLSSLFHKKIKPDRIIGNQTFEELSDEEVSDSIKIIQDMYDIIDFDYDELLKFILNDNEMIELYKQTSSGYEKLQLYRIIKVNPNTHETSNHESKSLMKFVNGAFHIENDYIYQLNPHEFELIPEYIIQGMDEDIAKITLSNV